MCCSVLIFVYSFCTVQTFIYKTFISQIVFDCSDDVRCVRTAAITSYDDVGRSPAPQPIGISLNKKNGLCRSTRLGCPGQYVCHFHPQKNSERFLFSGESACAETSAEKE